MNIIFEKLNQTGMNSDDTQPLLNPTNNIPLKVRKKKKKLRPPPPPLRRKLPGGSVVQITAEEFDEHIQFGEIEVARKESERISSLVSGEDFKRGRFGATFIPPSNSTTPSTEFQYISQQCTTMAAIPESMISYRK